MQTWLLLAACLLPALNPTLHVLAPNIIPCSEAAAFPLPLTHPTSLRARYRKGFS